MEQQVAAEIADLLADGEGRTAFRYMAATADSVGRILCGV
jgi:hypothetical protein